MRRRNWAATTVPVIVGLIAVGASAACGRTGGDAATPPGGGDVLGAASGSSATTPPVSPPLAQPLTCTRLMNAHLGSASTPYNGHPDYIPLSDGIWAGEDGSNVELRECAIGDMTGDGAADGVASVVLSTGGTGHFYSLAAWRNVGGEPVFAALIDYGDREPVTDITIADQKATVVYLTRTPDLPPATVNIERTVIYQLTGSSLVEVSRNDAPYTP